MKATIFGRLALILFVVILMVQTGQGQLYFPEDMVKVSAIIRDESNGAIIPFVNVLNQRIRGGTMSDAQGKFSVQADPSDTLTFKSIGFLDKKVPVSEIINKENPTVSMAPIRYQLGQVEVSGDAAKVNMNGIPVGKTSNIPAELRSDFTTPPKLLTAIFHPASFLYYKLSKSEKEKRNTLVAIRSEREWQLYSLVYNKAIVERITGFKGDQLDDFMVYFNANSKLSFNSNTYDVEKRVKDLLVQYLSKDEKK